MDVVGLVRRSGRTPPAAPSPPPAEASASRSFATSIRLVLLLVASLVTALADDRDRWTLGVLLAVLLTALVARRLAEGQPVQLAVLLTEAVLVAVGIAVAAGPPLALLICLPSTTVAAGLSWGYLGAALASGTSAGVLLVGRVLRAGEPGAAAFSAASAEWVLVALLTGVLAARIRSLTRAGAPSDRYAEANRLLAQLRAVTRGLPGSLDPGTVARTLLEECLAQADTDHGAVLLHVGGEQLVPLALLGYRRVPWRADLAEDGPITSAWLTGEPVVDRRAPDADGARAGSALVVLPILVERNPVGVVVLEWRRPRVLDSGRLPALAGVVARSALPLETAALFDELRITAATEERSRLAREMHDGIAQDLAFLGYELDALTAVLRRAGADDGVEQARQLRTHITALISDLRLSLSDLRSSVGPGRGLGAALSDYARSAGTSSGITAHLSLREGSTRLPADTEVQLLRIAHEAVSRARRRPGTQNLWVSLEADPPCAVLVIEDDAPSGPPSANGGTEVTPDMSDRAARLGARLSAEPRLPTGTRIRVTVGSPA